MSTFSNVFCSNTIKPTEAKFHVKLPWAGGGGAKICSDDLGHLTKLAAKPIYG